MAVRYSFQCPRCSASVELTITQAGQEIECAQCAGVFTAPRLGDIKKLPVAGGEKVVKAGGGANSPVKGWLFSGGLLLAVVAGVAAYAIQSYATSMYDFAQEIGGDIEQTVANELEKVDEMPAVDIYTIAAEAGKDSFQLEYREVPYRSLNIQSGILQNVAYGCWAVSGIGLLLLIVSFFISQEMTERGICSEYRTDAKGEPFWPTGHSSRLTRNLTPSNLAVPVPPKRPIRTIASRVANGIRADWVESFCQPF